MKYLHKLKLNIMRIREDGLNWTRGTFILSKLLVDWWCRSSTELLLGQVRGMRINTGIHQWRSGIHQNRDEKYKKKSNKVGTMNTRAKVENDYCLLLSTYSLFQKVVDFLLDEPQELVKGNCVSCCTIGVTIL